MASTAWPFRPLVKNLFLVIISSPKSSMSCHDFAKIVLFVDSHIGCNDGGNDGDDEIGDGDHEDDVDGNDEIF